MRPTLDARILHGERLLRHRVDDHALRLFLHGAAAGRLRLRYRLRPFLLLSLFHLGCIVAGLFIEDYDSALEKGLKIFVYVCLLTFGIAICHEAFRYPETVRWAAVRGAKIVFHPHCTGSEMRAGSTLEGISEGVKRRLL